jgi:hypothetical protein
MIAFIAELITSSPPASVCQPQRHCTEKSQVLTASIARRSSMIFNRTVLLTVALLHFSVVLNRSTSGARRRLRPRCPIPHKRKDNRDDQSLTTHSQTAVSSRLEQVFGPSKAMKNASVQQPLSREPLSFPLSSRAANSLRRVGREMTKLVPSAIAKGEIEGCPRSRF